MVEMRDDLPGVVVGILYHWLGDADLRVGQKGGQPLAVDVDAVPDDHVVLQGQTEAVADHLHAPVDLLLRLERTGLRVGGDGDAEVLGHGVDHGGHHLFPVLGGEFGQDGLGGRPQGLELDGERGPL